MKPWSLLRRHPLLLAAVAYSLGLLTSWLFAMTPPPPLGWATNVHWEPAEPNNFPKPVVDIAAVWNDSEYAASRLRKVVKNSQPLPSSIRVCLVTSAISGPTLTGGIGAAFLSYAQNLASNKTEDSSKFSVTVLFAAHPVYAHFNADYWVRQFASQGIQFIPLEEGLRAFHGPRLVVRAYRIFEYLHARDGDFDVIVFHDYLGNGYFLTAAKRQGLAFQSTVLMAQLHSTSRWTDELNSRPPRDHNTLAYYHLEERSIVEADIRVSPSAHYLAWLQRRLGFNATTHASTVIQNCLPPRNAEPALPLHDFPGSRTEPVPVQGLCFFGRLEPRKGLLVFLAALDLLPQAHFPSRVAFLGPDTRIDGQSARLLVLQHARDHRWPIVPEILTDMNAGQALQHMRIMQCAAVVPSLGDNSPTVIAELSVGGIPFVATRVGGVPELIDSESAGKLVAPGDHVALATSLQSALTSGIPLARLRVSPAATSQQHRDLLSVLVTSARESPLKELLRPARLRIALGLSSHNRPALLERAVASVIDQQYPPELMHVMIIDDGSTDPGIPSMLALLSARMARAGISHRITTLSTRRFVGYVRNAMLQQGAAMLADLVCLMDDDDTALPQMLQVYANVATATGADILTDFSDNFASTAQGPRFSHRSLAVGDAFAHNFFVNNYGKANLCVRPRAALAVGGHHEDFSPFVDWAFFARASLAGLHIELVPMALYHYTANSTGSIYYASMATKADHYRGHAKMLADVIEVAPAKLHDVLTLCHYQLAHPRVYGQGN